MAAVPNCSKQHSSPALTEEVVPGKDGTLQNVIVYLKGDFSTYSFEVPQSPASPDQNGCIYKPHVVALMVGQPLEVTNTDQATHNIHSLAKAIDRGMTHNRQERNQFFKVSLVRKLLFR
jgi:plastocyanin